MSAFPTTRWTLVQNAAGAPEVRRKALGELLDAYWKPVFVYYRAKGVPPEEAADAVQDLFADLCEKDFAAQLDPSKGRLRSWLKACADHHLAHGRSKERAAKRGGGVKPLPIEEIDIAADGEDPEQAYLRRWAETVMDRALAQLRSEKDLGIVEEFFGAGTSPPYREAATRAGMSVPQLKAAIHRARVRYRELVMAEVKETVTDDRDAANEWQALGEGA